MRKLFTQKSFLLCLVVLVAFAVQAQDKTDTELKQLISKNAGRLGLSATDINDAFVNSSFADGATGIRYIYLQQAYQSIGVFNQVMTIAFRNDEFTYSSGKFIYDIATKAPAAQPTVAAGEAVRKTAVYLSLAVPAQVNIVADRFATDKKLIFGPSGIAKQNIEVKLVWAQEDDGTAVHLAWDVSVDVLGSPDWWNVRIDALTGEFVNKNNLTVHDKQFGTTEDDNLNGNDKHNPGRTALSVTGLPKKGTAASPLIVPQSPIQAVASATYRVIPYPYESPYFAPPTLDVNPWGKAGPGNNATTYGWHYDGTTYHDSTRGNNVHAYLDAATRNNAGKPNFSAISTTPQPNLTFDFQPNFTVQPGDTTTRLAAITNLFYWNNLIHDLTYQYGFTEAAGNFQFTNTFNGVNRGGAGNDYVQAEAQDGLGTNNANFNTNVDGILPRMQMYLWTGPANVTVLSPATIAGSLFAQESNFSNYNKMKDVGPLTDTVVYYNDDAAGTTHYACGVPGAPANSVAGKIALIVRGVCVGGFVEKVKNAQNAGASGVIMVNNVPGLPITMGGTDSTITIPAVMISMDDGAALAAQLGNNVVVTMAAGPDRDGDFDNGIICHEYGHGVSNRLTGGRTNSGCLGNAEQGGEGWSDYLGLMMTTDWSTAQVTDGPKPRAVGNYADAYLANGPGIRVAPYSTNMLVNPLTYANVATNTAVHAIGTVWCTAIWDMTWYIIQQENSISPDLFNSQGTGGNIIAMKLVMEGMKLQNCRPGFLDARDAILAADSILFGFRHKCAIWNAFARRGMGVSAVQGLSTSATDQVAAFDIPTGLYLTRSIVPATVQSGNNVTVNMNVSCQCQIPVSGYIRDTIPAGFSYVSSSAGGTLSGNVVTFSPLDFFTTVNETKTFSIVLKATAPGCNITASVNDNRDGATVGGLTSTALTGTTQWVASTTRFRSPSNAWFAADVAGLRDFVLTSNPFTVGNLSILSFWHYFVTEDKLDGGRIEYSADGGTTWLDAAPYILQNGYNDTTISTSPWGGGQKVFTGVSYAQSSGQFSNTLVDFSSFNGQSLRIRFRMRTNATNATQGYEGWFIDDITLNNGCGGLNETVLFNSSNNKVDSIFSPVFITPVVLPLNLLSFTAKPVGKTVLLTWQTAAEINTKSFVIEHSTNRTLWSDAGTIAANGSGNGTYVMYHQQPVEGANYYRIKMIDKDGSFTYTDIRLVNFSAKGNALFTIVPNPANTTATLYLDKNIKSGKVLVYDAQGKVVQTLTVTNLSNGYQLQTSKLPAGTYLVSITSGSTMQTGKLIVSH